MRRIKDDEIPFYDRMAERIGNVLGSASCTMTQSSLAKRIGWNRPSLCNFINRIDKGIAAHFIPRIAHVLGVSMDYLISGGSLELQPRNAWDPRFDETQIILDKQDELRQRNLPALLLTSIFPLQTLPQNALVANFVNSIVGGANAVIAERWHELIQRERERLLHAGCANIEYLIPMEDLLRLPRRLPPYQAFSSDEVFHILQNLKKEWIRQRGLRIIAVRDSMLDPDTRLVLSGHLILSVIGREIQFRIHKDLRVEWDDAPTAVNASRECLIRLKRAAGFSVGEHPSAEQVEQLVDVLLKQVDPISQSAAPASRKGIERHFDRSLHARITVA